MKLDVVDKTEIEVNFNVDDNKIAHIIITGGYHDNYFRLINYTNLLRIYIR